MTTKLNLPLEAKVWIYQSSRPFTLKEIDLITDKTEAFIANWQSHGSDLTGAFEIIHNRFIVLSVDESGQEATGCSIDKSVNLIKQLENDLDINLMDKSQVAYVSAKGDIEFVDFRNIKTLIKRGDLHSDTFIFDLSISTFKDYKENWKVPASQSWLSRYF